MIKPQDKLAFDFQSARAFDEDGHLRVKQTPISKGNVCPYYGHEIPGFEKLGLDAKKVYHLFRDPAELERAAATFNGKPLLLGHNPVSAQAHDHARTVGAVSNARWKAPYLVADLACWVDGAIDGIRDNSIRELSASYRYDPVMVPGVHAGVRYDGRMTNIRANHIALVEVGRAGRDVAVCDAELKRDHLQERIAGVFNDYATYEDLARCLAKYGLLPQVIAADAAGYEGSSEMSPIEMDTVLKFLIAQLPEDKLAELDEKLAGEGSAENLAAASDAQIRRRNWLAMDARTRHAQRKARNTVSAQSEADRARRNEMFPHMERIGRAY